MDHIDRVTEYCSVLERDAAHAAQAGFDYALTWKKDGVMRCEVLNACRPASRIARMIELGIISDAENDSPDDLEFAYCHFNGEGKIKVVSSEDNSGDLSKMAMAVLKDRRERYLI